MKKFFFALQVFGIIALFPIYVILEMNHGSPENKNHVNVIEKAEETAIQVSLKAEAKNENSIPDIVLAGSAALLNKNEIIKALAEAAHNAY
jgi:hypothetical protein